MKSFAAAVTVLGVFFATAAVPPALLEFLQQRWRSPTGMLTFAFAVYALSLLVTLLVAGSLSDRAGRRPVLLAACSLQVAVCVVFLAAGSVWWTAAGLIGEWASDPVAWVFVPLLVVFAGAAVFSRLMPETAPGRITGASSAVWRPRARRPRCRAPGVLVRRPDGGGNLVARGLYLSLAPAIARQVFGLNGISVGGVAIGLLTGAGAIVHGAARGVVARSVAVAANLAMLTGVAAALVAIRVHSIAVFLAASAVGGAGFGAGFSSWIRLMMPDVAPAERTRFYSAFYLVNYLAFGLPALVAGEVIGAAGLDATVVAYGALAMIGAGAGLRNEISMGRSKRNAQGEVRSSLLSREGS